jgi:hypothetical protein
MRLNAETGQSGGSCFRRIQIDEPAILRLREWSRMDQDLRRPLKSGAEREEEQKVGWWG